ncbi:MAG: PilZ domain-containing protein [SAR324 cluster bacterium]|nr:PilZ domain-containing protein [SAR324 cluster bacterium]
MAQPDWKNLYYELVESLRLSTQADEKRKHPRLIIPEGVELSVRIQGDNHRLVDISPGGISFFSHTPFSGGREVSIVYSESFQILSEIVYCRVDQLEPAEGENNYRIGARFVVDDDGFRIMVLVLEFYSSKLIRNIA